MSKAFVYILSNCNKNVVYVGCTDQLRKRIYFHKNRLIPGFTKKYNVDQLIYYEECRNVEEALIREKQIKGFRREKKDFLIQKMNPQWLDLYNMLST